MSYSTLLLGQQITSLALAAFCDEILASRGALPVGEIGKILQDSLENQVHPLSAFAIDPCECYAAGLLWMCMCMCMCMWLMCGSSMPCMRRLRPYICR